MDPLHALLPILLNRRVPEPEYFLDRVLAVHSPCSNKDVSKIHFQRPRGKGPRRWPCTSIALVGPRFSADGGGRPAGIRQQSGARPYTGIVAQTDLRDERAAGRSHGAAGETGRAISVLLP